jgi:cysteine-rich repeat protein
VCTLGPHCGDGVLSSDFEECDDGNRSNNDGCDAECSIETAFTASE